MYGRGSEHLIEMGKKRIDKNKIISAFLSSAFEKSAGATSLADIASLLDVNKASLYNHFSSKDEIYEATLDLCASYIENVSFFSEPISSLIKLSYEEAFSKTIRRYFRSYEMDPLFQMHTFIQSGKFFSERAAGIAKNEAEKIVLGISEMTEKFIDAGKIKKEDKETVQKKSVFLANAVSSLLDKHIVRKKETIRLNPEAGAGSLFLLPSDDNALDAIVSECVSFWKSLFE